MENNQSVNEIITESGQKVIITTGVIEETDITPQVGINKVKQIKINELNLQCKDEICSGFDCNIKNGIFQHYDFDNDTQINMLGIQNKIIKAILLKQVIPEIKWYASNQTICDTWTMDEFIALCEYAEQFKQYRIDKYKILKAKVLNVETEDEIKNINWDTESPIIK